MKKLIDIFDVIKRRRTIIMDEKDVTKVLSSVNKYAQITHNDGLLVANCGWEDEPSKWFILFYSPNKPWSCIVEEISKLESVEIEN